MASLRSITAAVASFALGTSSTPPAHIAAQDDFDCPARVFILERAQQLQPFLPQQAFVDMADALNGDPEKAPGCNVLAAATAKLGQLGSSSSGRFHHQEPIRAADNVFYADFVNGADGNSGNITSPFKTIAAALGAARAAPGTDTIVLRSGTFYQTSTIVLTSADSGLTIQAYPGEDVWVSGAAPLSGGVTWSPYNVSANSTWSEYPNQNAVFGAVPSPSVLYNGTYTAWSDCQAACEADYAAGGPCTIWTWHDANQGSYALQCYFRIDRVWSPTGEAGHYSGQLQVGPNVWSAPLAAAGVTSVPGLRWNGRRMIRARFPNSDPEVDGFGTSFTTTWTPQQAPRTPAIQIDLATPVRNTSVSMFQTFTAGVGGTCDRFQPNSGYWCSTNVQGGGSVIYFVPIAMQANASQQLPNLPYKNATGAIVQTWRPGHWASWMFEVGEYTFDAATGAANFSFSIGGFQGSRGENAGEGTYIENVFEELDVPAEWYYDPVAGVLYLWHNATSGTAPPTDGSLVVPQLKHLFNITGDSQASPLTDVSLIGFGLRDTAYTYMDPHSLPSGGDWAMERSAVVFLENTERVTISGCVFERVDGNAVLIAGYARNATVQYSEFYQIGSTAIASWGVTEGGDDRLPYGYGLYGTNGTQPRGNRILYNLVHELGIWEKQSSFYTQFRTGRNLVQGNIVYNGPRAHVNFNDGFMGSSQLLDNILFNSCRESGDHGPFNSWDRDVAIWDGLDGQPTFVKDMDIIAGNVMLGDYATLCAIDNDDGSSYYTTHHNFFIYGGCGLKNDFEGHDNIHHHNVYAFLTGQGLNNGYGGEVHTPGQGALDGHEDQFYSNYVVQTNDGEYAIPVCSGRGKTVLGNNSVFTPTGNISECGMPLTQWQAAGNDLGTTAAPFPSTADILAAAQAVLAAAHA